jgi:DNA-binding MarR family transcriptional regulator
LNQAEYMALAEFRYQLRKFLRHMEEKSRGEGLNPQQYQFLLAIKGLPRPQAPTVSALAERMQLNHNSTVELADRCERRGLVSRLRTGSDRRHVTLFITAEGDVLLQKLATAARQELRSIGPVLVESVLGLIQDQKARKPGAAESKKKAGGKKAGP